MPPWAERLLTKIRRLSVVRRLLLRDERDRPVVSARVYGLDGGRPGPRNKLRRTPVQAESSQSFSNSQSVPDSSKMDGGAGSGGSGGSEPKVTQASAVKLAAAETDTSLVLMRSSDSECTSSSSGSSANAGRASAANYDGASAGRKRRTTPRIRISDSSHMTDADAAALHQFITRHMPQRRRLRAELPGGPELLEGRTANSAAAEHNADVSVPASFALLLPPPGQLAASSLPDVKTKLMRRVCDEFGEGPWTSAAAAGRQVGKELLVALLLNDTVAGAGRSVTPPLQQRARASLKFATMALAKSPSPSPSPSPSKRPGRDRRRPSRSPATADSHLTRTITFSVARDGRKRTAAKPATADTVGATRRKVGLRRRRWLVPTTSEDRPSAEVSSPTTSSMTTTSPSTATPSASASPRRRRRKQQQPQKQQQAKRWRRRGGGAPAYEPATFRPTFSKIVEWSEATDSSR